MSDSSEDELMFPFLSRYSASGKPYPRRIIPFNPIAHTCQPVRKTLDEGKRFISAFADPSIVSFFKVARFFMLL